MNSKNKLLLKNVSSLTVQFNERNICERVIGDWLVSKCVGDQHHVFFDMYQNVLLNDLLMRILVIPAKKCDVTYFQFGFDDVTYQKKRIIRTILISFFSYIYPSSSFFISISTWLRMYVSHMLMFTTYFYVLGFYPTSVTSINNLNDVVRINRSKKRDRTSRCRVEAWIRSCFFHYYYTRFSKVFRL